MREYIEKIFNGTQKEYFEYISNRLRNNEKTFIITVNPETIRYAREEKKVDEMLRDSNNSLVPDGVSIVKAGKMLNLDFKERITGIDIMKYLLEEGNRQAKSVYFFGAKPEIVEQLAKRVEEEYKNIKVLGYSDGYMEDKDGEFQKIVKLKPDLCFVALGIPKQEMLIYDNLNKFDKGIFVGVGGSFDVLSGSKKRAPKIFIKTNTEWLYRIVKEPFRIKRFWNSNVKFLFDVSKEKKGK